MTEFEALLTEAQALPAAVDAEGLLRSARLLSRLSPMLVAKSQPQLRHALRRDPIARAAVEGLLELLRAQGALLGAIAEHGEQAGLVRVETRH